MIGSMKSHVHGTRLWGTLLVLLAGGLAAGGLPVGQTAAAAAESASGFTLQDTPGEALDVLLDGRLVARYVYAYDGQRYDETYKPFLHVIDAERGLPITKGPGGFYTHHRGIFVGFSRLAVGGKTYNLWGMGGGPQVHQNFTAQQAGQDQASFTAVVHWNTRAGERLLEEERTFVFHRVPSPDLVQIDAVSRLSAVAGAAQLGGDPEHAGLHYRPANEVDAKQTRYLFPGEAVDPRKDRDLDWVGATYVLGDATYSVVQMNHPDNPTGTIWSAYRDYGRFGAFAAAELLAGESLTLRYRFRVRKGELPPREQIQQWREEYAKR